jgi:hypothetical protein
MAESIERTESAAARSRDAARAVIERVFADVTPGLRYRLWDGFEGDVGHPDGSFTLVIRDAETFRKCFSRQNTKIMAEAFVEKGIDVDGDLFAGLRIANQLEDLKLGWVDRLAIALELRRV